MLTPYLAGISDKSLLRLADNNFKSFSLFCRCFEFNAVFPHDHKLKIAIWDHDMTTSDDLIGQTEIDLEIRYFTKHRANCGLAETYEE